MNKKRNIAISCGFFAIALLIVVYGAGFSWRTVILVGVAFVLYLVGDYFWVVAFAARPFTRFQFRIGLNIGQALHDAGLYGEELSEAVKLISNGMEGRSWITFTWLDPELFYINTTNQYSSTLEISIDLPAHGQRASKRTFELSDQIEMRTTTEGYELVLLTREQLYSWSQSTRGKSLVLFKLPYSFFWTLQGDPLKAHEKETEILKSAGLTYHSDPEVWNAWEYRSQYGSFRWWDV